MASTNGKAARSEDKVRVAIIGVGNCASSLVQGIEYYKDAKPDEFVPGLMHVDLGGYHVHDVEFTAAFDVVEGKVGKDLDEAIWAYPNNTIKFSDVPKTGVKVDRTFQLNFGGNSDFLNMLERERLESKKISKTYSIKSTVPYEIEDKNIHVGPSDHVPWLEDRKWAYIRLEGTAFGDVPLNAELKIEVWDSPNSAGVVTDAVRLTKLALNNGISGTLEGPSAYLMKSPPVQYPDEAARDLVEDFIPQNARGATKAPAPGQVETTS